MHNNLVLSENAVKRHSKRLHDKLKTLGHGLSLCESQNFLAETLGFKNYHELKTVLSNNAPCKVHTLKDLYELYTSLENTYLKTQYERYEFWLYRTGYLRGNFCNTHTNITMLECDSDIPIQDADLKLNNFDFNNILKLILSEEQLAYISTLGSDTKLPMVIQGNSKISQDLTRVTTYKLYIDKRGVKAVNFYFYYNLKGHLKSLPFSKVMELSNFKP